MWEVGVGARSPGESPPSDAAFVRARIEATALLRIGPPPVYVQNKFKAKRHEQMKQQADRRTDG